MNLSELPMISYELEPGQLKDNEKVDSQHPTRDGAERSAKHLIPPWSEVYQIRPLWYSASVLPKNHPEKRLQFYTIILPKE